MWEEEGEMGKIKKTAQAKSNLKNKDKAYHERRDETLHLLFHGRVVLLTANNNYCLLQELHKLVTGGVGGMKL